MLAFDDDIEVATPVLRLSERLDERALLANAGSRSQRHLFAIAQRTLLSEAATDMLRCAFFCDAGFRMLVKRSASNDHLAIVVGMRTDIPRPHFLLLPEKASSAARNRLPAENPDAGAVIDRAVAEVVGGVRNEARKASADFGAAQVAAEPHPADR